MSMIIVLGVPDSRRGSISLIGEFVPSLLREFFFDEEGILLPPKIITKKGPKKVKYCTSGQKAQMTVISCGNAIGQALPLFIIFAT